MCDSIECKKIITKTPKNVKLLVDVAHLKVSAKSLKFDTEKFFNDCNDLIGGYHLSDNDGLSDIYLTRQKDAGKLYKNLGDFQFKDVTREVGIEPSGMWSTGVTFVDINDDGWLDLFICGFDSPNRLYINMQSRFKESASMYGLDFKGASVVMSFADYDLDGDLDAYLLTNRVNSASDIGDVKIIRDKNIYMAEKKDR